MFQLPDSIKDHIADMADVGGYWKKVFRNEVLTKIDKGYRMIGLSPTGELCPNCYYYHKTDNGCDYDCGDISYHLYTEDNEIVLREVSYEEFTNYCGIDSWSYDGSYEYFWLCEQERIKKEKEEERQYDEKLMANLARLGFA